MTNFTMLYNFSSMRYAVESVPGLADVGDPHGDGLELHPDVWRGLEKVSNG